MTKYTIIFIVALVALTGCSELEQQMIEKQTRGQIQCLPADAQGCIGWVGDKSIIIEEEP